MIRSCSIRLTPSFTVAIKQLIWNEVEAETQSGYQSASQAKTLILVTLHALRIIPSRMGVREFPSFDGSASQPLYFKLSVVEGSERAPLSYPFPEGSLYIRSISAPRN